MRKTLILSFLAILIIVIIFLWHSNSAVVESVLRKGDSYSDCLASIRNSYDFLFRIRMGGGIYKWFKHHDLGSILIFKDDKLAYIGDDLTGAVVYGTFRVTKSGREYSLGYRKYMNPIAHAAALIDRIPMSRDQTMVLTGAIEGYGCSKTDLGLTAAAMVSKFLCPVVSIGTNYENRITDDLGIDYGGIPLGISKKRVHDLLGRPIYVDKESGVEYHGRYESVRGEKQLLGLAYTNGIVEGVFSPRMLDLRITCKCSGEEYLGSTFP